MDEYPTRRSYPRTPTVSYDLPMHGQRNIRKCKEQLLMDIAVWAKSHPGTLDIISQRAPIADQLHDIVARNFRPLEK